MDRIRRGAQLSDENTLLVVGSHLRGAVEAWWSIHEEIASDWVTFKVLFKDEIAYWEDIQAVKQGPGTNEECLFFRRLVPAEITNGTPRLSRAVSPAKPTAYNL
ncbi:hypothetical protein BCR42DRAFT_443368 [Absidia repens]|uniref:Retrotransposon gag domain-containing protein n=1 Tax=Absidia repens TaxID=90262 RepID=A0A1X2HZU7_9FUNG|nr:hypothetical protein BCR42DRAFT_443368 [Absidia repens]